MIAEIRKAPKFNLTRLDGVVTVSANLEFAGEILACLDDFLDLEPYLYSFREQMRTAVDGQTAPRRRVGSNGLRGG